MGLVKTRLSVMMILQYAVWGVWLPPLAQYLQAPVEQDKQRHPHPHQRQLQQRIPAFLGYARFRHGSAPPFCRTAAFQSTQPVARAPLQTGAQFVMQ